MNFRIAALALLLPCVALGAQPSMIGYGPARAAGQRAAEQSEPSCVTGHAIALAGEIHSYLRDHYVVGQEPRVRDARLVLVDCARKLLTTGLGLLGIAAPERM